MLNVFYPTLLCIVNWVIFGNEILFEIPVRSALHCRLFTTGSVQFPPRTEYLFNTTTEAEAVVKLAVDPVPVTPVESYEFM